MANWISVEATAKKYGISEKEINEWIRLRYISGSFLCDEPNFKDGMFVDIDEFERVLTVNALPPLPDDETTLRITTSEYESLLLENASLQDFNDEILEFIYFYHRKEERLNKDIKKLETLTRKMLSLSSVMTHESERKMFKRSKYIWAILRYFFTKPKSRQPIFFSR